MLVAAAEVIVAAHGGQCFNLIFARPGAVFVEILPGQRSMSALPMPELACSFPACLRVLVHHPSRRDLFVHCQLPPSFSTTID
eukprot:926436-Rhodomonas_salina.5